MGLTQQIVLAVMLDDDAAFSAEQAFAADAAIVGLRVRLVRCTVCYDGVVQRCHSVKNSYQCNNDNHYQQIKKLGNPFCEK